MNVWRNQIRERVRVLCPVEKETRGTFESAPGVPSMNYLASMLNLTSMTPEMDDDCELIQLLQNRVLLMFFHPDALQPRDIARCIHDCMLACEEINTEAGTWPPPGMPEPPLESAMLIFAQQIATYDIDHIARLVPLEGTSWAFQMKATSNVRARDDGRQASPIVVIDASSQELPPFARWLLSAPGRDDGLDEVLEDESLPASVRERIVAYSAARLNAQATLHVLSQGSSRPPGGSRTGPRRN